MESVHVMPGALADPFIISVCQALSWYAIFPPVSYTCDSSLAYCPQATRATCAESWEYVDFTFSPPLHPHSCFPSSPLRVTDGMPE